ncbi:hypothetical protein TUBRATIS_14630 [Tubulinosema ratisbonensis]|uniref:Uncharacterized protein n=1 Tax=Tubulinosema ratisbonensis TaxID=291195 RepID=A0A437ALU0_9MICR|nr:hypothetical protein TUBRATIS_14630 [Tubulinosema ratisbonensis]
MKKDYQNYISRFRFLSEKQCTVLKDALSKEGITLTDLIALGRKHKIAKNKVINFVEAQNRINKSMWNDFYNNAEETIKRIMLNNDYCMVCYLRSKVKNKVNLGDKFYEKRI